MVLQGKITSDELFSTNSETFLCLKGIEISQVMKELMFQVLIGTRLMR